MVQESYPLAAGQRCSAGIDRAYVASVALAHASMTGSDADGRVTLLLRRSRSRRRRCLGVRRGRVGEADAHVGLGVGCCCAFSHSVPFLPWVLVGDPQALGLTVYSPMNTQDEEQKNCIYSLASHLVYVCLSMNGRSAKTMALKP